jgi:hypothetical protein
VLPTDFNFDNLKDPFESLIDSTGTALGGNANHQQQKCQQLMDASKLQLAPMMMEYTDIHHFRHVFRLVSNGMLLYTEMVTDNALPYKKEEKLANLRQSIHKQLPKRSDKIIPQMNIFEVISSSRQCGPTGTSVSLTARRLQSGTNVQGCTNSRGNDQLRLV